MSTTYVMDEAAEHRLDDFLEGIRTLMHHRSQREEFAIYMLGLLSDAERKSVEPMACLTVDDPAEANPAHQRLLTFINRSPWDDTVVRRYAAQYALAAMTEKEKVISWIVDDTGFIKQGKQSVGVQRQYTGSAGKITNCQVAASLTLATPTQHLPVDFELYLPECWIDDLERRGRARIPEDAEFRTKPEIAIAMMRRAIDNGLPRGMVLADAAYGTSSTFRREVRALSLPYTVGVNSEIKVWPKRKVRLGKAKSVKDVAMQLGVGAFDKVEWQEGTKQTLWSFFARIRVVPCHDDGTPVHDREEVWLLIEWPANEPEPTKYTLSTLPANTSMKKLVWTVKQRYHTERMYEDMKGEVGLDHFEGRSYPGWNHHVSVALCAYAFTVAELARSFPPSAARSSAIGEDDGAPAAPFRRLVRHRSPRHFTSYSRLASTLPSVSSSAQPRDIRVESTPPHRGA
jgi:SRSO17 transposase